MAAGNGSAADDVRRESVESGVGRDSTKVDHRIGEYASAGLVIVTTIVLFRFISTGLDLTDEAWYIHDVGRGTASGEDYTQFHVILGWFAGSAPSVRGLRAAGLMLDVLSASILGLTARWVVLRHGVLRSVPSPTLFVAVPVSAQLLAHSWLPATPSYNNLGAWLINGTLCLLAVAVMRPARWYAGVGLGSLVWLHVFVKWPSAVLMLVIIVAVLVLCQRWRGLWVALATLGGLASVASQTTVGGLNLSALRQSTTQLSGTESHGAGTLVRDYATATKAAGIDLVSTAPGVVAILVVLIAVALRKRALPCLVVSGLLLSLAAIDDDYGALLTGSPRERRLVLAAVIVALTTGTLLAILRRPKTAVAGVREHRDSAVLAGALAAGPLVAAIGSDNDLWMQVETAAAPIGVLAVVVVCAIGGTSAALVPLVAIFAIQTMFASVVSPYRQVDLRDQRVPLRSLGISIDADRAATLAALRSLASEELDVGDRVFVAFKQPGLALFLDAPIAGPTYTGNQVDASERICPAIVRNRDQFDEVGMVLLTEELEPSTKRCIRSAWPGFDRFEVVAELDPVVADAQFIRVLVPKK